jgi:threonine aldolase
VPSEFDRVIKSFGHKLDATWAIAAQFKHFFSNPELFDRIEDCNNRTALLAEELKRLGLNVIYGCTNFLFVQVPSAADRHLEKHYTLYHWCPSGVDNTTSWRRVMIGPTVTDNEVSAFLAEVQTALVEIGHYPTRASL